MVLKVKVGWLVRDDLDLDHRCQVGRGLGFVELIVSDVALHLAGGVNGGAEDLTVEQVELGVKADGADFVGGHQKLLELTNRRPTEATGRTVVVACDSTSAKTVAFAAVAVVGAPVVVATCTPLR